MIITSVSLIEAAAKKLVSLTHRTAMGFAGLSRDPQSRARAAYLTACISFETLPCVGNED